MSGKSSERRGGGQRVGLVLGAGGILGGAWLVGALHAVATETGWDPGSAQVIVGTSAGAMIGAHLASGVPPWYLVAHSAGETPGELDDDGDQVWDEADRSLAGSFRLERRGLPFGPGSWRLALASLARPYRYSPTAMVSGWLPRGLVSTEPLKESVRRACAEDWAPHPNFWAVAVDYGTGRRVAFGRADAPPATLPDAVAASCAIPGFYRAVEIGGRSYVDGGVSSTSNLDLLETEPLDLVVALNPMSSLHPGARSTVAQRVAFRMREVAGRRLGSEAKRLRAAGLEVVLLQPTVLDLDVIGTNLMSGRRRHEVIETAVQSVTEHLRDSGVGERLAQLPPGLPALVRRPPGPVTDWPDLRQVARKRWPTARAA